VIDVTQFSRQKALARSDTDIYDLLNRSIDLISARLKEKDATVDRRFERQKLVGFWDADQLTQVFLNVIANAVDASPPRGVITISAEPVAINGHGQPGPQVARVTIADQGTGIDPGNLNRIFEPFFSTKKRGTGLGLAIVRQIVEHHEGKIVARSDGKNGSRFEIDLPL
jgi:signal transduction histidine kinase